MFKNLITGIAEMLMDIVDPWDRYDYAMDRGYDPEEFDDDTFLDCILGDISKDEESCGYALSYFNLMPLEEVQKAVDRFIGADLAPVFFDLCKKHEIEFE